MSMISSSVNSRFQTCLNIWQSWSGSTAQKSHQMPLNLMELKFCPMKPLSTLPLMICSALPSRLSGGPSAFEHLVGDGIGPHVAATPVGGGVGEAHAEGAPGVVAGQLQVLDLHGHLGHAVLGGQGPGTQGKVGADPLPLRDQAGRGHVALDLAEAKTEVGDALLGHVHGQSPPPTPTRWCRDPIRRTRG